MTRLFPPMRALAVAVAVLCAHIGDAAAQAYRDVAPIAPPAAERPRAPQPPQQPADESPAVAIEDLRGIAFARAGEAASGHRRSAAQGAITSTDLPLLDAAFLDTFAADLGKPLTFARLAQIRRAVVQRYRAAGQPLVDVYVPGART